MGFSLWLTLLSLFCSHYWSLLWPPLELKTHCQNQLGQRVPEGTIGVLCRLFHLLNNLEKRVELLTSWLTALPPQAPGLRVYILWHPVSPEGIASLWTWSVHWLSYLRIHLQWRKCEFDPWVWKIPWMRDLPTPVFLLGEFRGQRSLAGCSPWRCRESDMTEWLNRKTIFRFGVYAPNSPCWAPIPLLFQRHTHIWPSHSPSFKV